MNAAHLHLLVNHLPVLGTIFCAALLAVAIYLRDGRFQKISLAFLILVALTGVAAFLSGDAASDSIGRLQLPGLSESALQAHEDAAELAYMLLNAIGVASFMALLFYAKAAGPPRWASLGILLLTLIAAAAFARAAYLGGEIRHTEIRSAPSLQSQGESGRTGPDNPA